MGHMQHPTWTDTQADRHRQTDRQTDRNAEWSNFVSPQIYQVARMTDTPTWTNVVQKKIKLANIWNRFTWDSLVKQQFIIVCSLVAKDTLFYSGPAWSAFSYIPPLERPSWHVLLERCHEGLKVGQDLDSHLNVDALHWSGIWPCPADQWCTQGTLQILGEVPQTGFHQVLCTTLSSAGVFWVPLNLQVLNE